MTLHNYAYSGNSGWNGWPLPGFDSLYHNKLFAVEATYSKCIIQKVDGNGWLGSITKDNIPSSGKWSLKIENPTGKILNAIFVNNSDIIKTSRLHDGINVIEAPADAYMTFYFDCNAFAIGDSFTIKQYPLYPGALVSDGVDDYAVSDEVIDEEIKAIVASGEPINENINYLFYMGQSGAEDSNRIGAYFSDNKICFYPNDVLSDLSADGIYAHSGFSLNPNSELYIARAFLEYGASALYQLRLIKTKPTDLQLEVIKHQVLMEHNDYIKEMG